MNDLPSFFEDIPITTFESGSTLQTTGIECNNFLLVISGTIRVYTVSLDGRDKTLYKITKNEVCIVTTSCLLSNRPFPVVAEAQTDLQLKFMSKQKFKQLMDSSPLFQSQILQILSSRIGSLIDTISLLNTFSVQIRLYKWLLNIDKPFVTITHAEIANDIGSSREVVSRHLKRLEQQNVITTHRGEIIINNRDYLKNMT